MLCRHKLINVSRDGSSERLTSFKLNIKTGPVFVPTLFILTLQLTFPNFSYNTCLTLRAAKVRVTFSLESLIRLAHGSSFRNSLSTWDVRAGHYRLRAFSQVVTDLRGRTVSLVPAPKTRLFVPETGTVFPFSTKTFFY